MTNHVQQCVNIEPNWAGVRRWAEAGLRGARTRKEKAAFQEILRMCDDEARRRAVQATENALATC